MKDEYSNPISDLPTTYIRIRDKQIKDYYVQCAAYAYAHNELFDTNIKQIVILITVENTEPQIFTGNMLNYIPDLKYRINKYYELFRGN